MNSDYETPCSWPILDCKLSEEHATLQKQYAAAIARAEVAEKQARYNSFAGEAYVFLEARIKDLQAQLAEREDEITDLAQKSTRYITELEQAAATAKAQLATARAEGYAQGVRDALAQKPFNVLLGGQNYSAVLREDVASLLDTPAPRSSRKPERTATMTDTPDILAGLVKPLGWVETAPGLYQSDVFMIDTKCSGKNGGVVLIYHHHLWEYSTFEAAQAAANAYHVDRVLASIDADKLQALVETAQWARNRLDIIADESWCGDGRDLKLSIIGIFADFDKALSDCGSHVPTTQVDKDT